MYVCMCVCIYTSYYNLIILSTVYSFLKCRILMQFIFLHTSLLQLYIGQGLEHKISNLYSLSFFN